ncbi:ankyrin [Lojkania enalia]|uniref:Ankyrin n=1 Tax=Lojkania enalia TaxID=147567 RepID=A0A9P4N9N1_9PLEO|nr:ankyrin [Didymosphaeria enalia]
MAASEWSSEQLITLCQRGDQEQLLSVLQQPSAIQVVLGFEEVVFDSSNPTMTLRQLNLQRMITAASSHQNVGVVEELISFGRQHDVAADVMLTTETIYAAMNKSAFQILRSFETLDPNIFTRGLSPGQTILELACQGGPLSEPFPCNSYLPLVQYMMDKGVDPNNEIASSKGPGYVLLLACRSASVEIVECLLEHGVVVAGSRATRTAARHSRKDVLKILLRYGADLNECYSTEDINGSPGTALHVATENNKVSTVRWLLEHKADPTIRNSEGKTARDLIPEPTSIPERSYKALRDLLH